MNTDFNDSDLIETLLEKPYWVVDFLPSRVPETGGGQFFAAEQYFLRSFRGEELRRKFADFLLKLNCYYAFRVCRDDETDGTDNPDPEVFAEWILQNRGTISIILPSENSLITLSSDDTHMTVYAPSAELLTRIRSLANVEGLFIWKPENVKRGLIMEGGAMRGMFTCGVLDVLMENDIKFDGAIGVSAGATFGCNIKSGQIGRALRYNKKYCRDPRYCSLQSLLKTGDLYGADFCYRELPETLDPFDSEAFRKNPMEFYAVATDVLTGKAVYHKCTDGGENDITWIRASASMPLVSKPVKIDGHALLDGGIVDSIPYAYLEKLGYNRNMIILTQPDGYVKRKSAAFPLMWIMLRRYPKIAEAMSVRHKRYNRQMEEVKEREASGNAFIIRPPEDLKISRTEKDPEELERVYQTGRIEAEKRLSDLRSFLYG